MLCEKSTYNTFDRRKEQNNNLKIGNYGKNKTSF